MIYLLRIYQQAIGMDGDLDGFCMRKRDCVREKTQGKNSKDMNGWVAKLYLKLDQ
jgi:hypothetical protein